jgi:hypothetical protein
MATPTSALASAGASLTPSPTIATGPCARRNSSMALVLCAGSRLACQSSMLAWRAIALATRSWSPLSMATPQAERV